MRAEKQLAASDDAIRAEGYAPARQRQAVPPNAWDDIVVSYRRGQAWARDTK
jgi:hypothetical protein